MTASSSLHNGRGCPRSALPKQWFIQSQGPWGFSPWSQHGSAGSCFPGRSVLTLICPLGQQLQVLSDTFSQVGGHTEKQPSVILGKERLLSEEFCKQYIVSFCYNVYNLSLGKEVHRSPCNLHTSHYLLVKCPSWWKEKNICDVLVFHDRCLCHDLETWNLVALLWQILLGKRLDMKYNKWWEKGFPLLSENFYFLLNTNTLFFFLDA